MSAGSPGGLLPGDQSFYSPPRADEPEEALRSPGYLDGGDNLYVVGSNGGQPTEPAWSLNLKSNPEAEVQFGSQHIVTEVELLDGQDREETWQRYVATYPPHEKAQDWTDREFPVFRIPVNVTFAPAAPTRKESEVPGDSSRCWPEVRTTEVLRLRFPDRHLLGTYSFIARPSRVRMRWDGQEREMTRTDNVLFRFMMDIVAPVGV